MCLVARSAGESRYDGPLLGNLYDLIGSITPIRTEAPTGGATART
jgi:hypothetical protein